MEYMELRGRIVTIARRMAQAGLVSGTSGNVSSRTPDGKGILITPSGVDYAELAANMIVLVDEHGMALEDGLMPSSETPMHTAIYRQRPDVGGIVHTHSRYATTLACLGRGIPPIHYLVAVLGGRIPLAPYATYGTEQLADRVVEALGTRYLVTLLQNHGQVAIGPTVEKAYGHAELAEHLAELSYLASLAGEPILLTQEQLTAVEKQFRSYGQPLNSVRSERPSR